MAIQYEQGCKVKVKHGILIKRSPKDVFDFLSECDNFPLWQGTLHEIHEKKNTAKTDYGAECLASGSRVRDSRNVLGKKIESEYEVVDFSPGESLTMRIVSGPIDYEMRWTCESHNGGTWVSAEGEGDLGTDTPVTPEAASLGAQTMLESDLATLRHVLESRG